MSDVKPFDHFMRKLYEVLHLHHRHYLPQGKPEPLYYREVFYELFKVYDKGVLEEMSQEPIIEEEVKQLDMLTIFFQENSDIMADKGNGTDVDQEKEKTP
jgi:hypothetical protein